MQSTLRTWWWLPLMVLGALLITSAWLGSWLSDVARTEAAEAANLPLEQVEADGLDIRLTGLADAAAAERAIEAVGALESSQTVTGEVGVDGDGTESATATDGGSTATTAGSASSDDNSSDGNASTEDADDDGPGTAAESGTQEGEADDEAPPAALTVAFASDGLTIDGVVDGPAAQRIIAAATAELGTDQVIDAIDVGTVATEGGTMVVTGAPTDTAELDRWRAATAAIADVADLEVIDELDQSGVTLALNDLFDLEPIQFDPRSDTLSADSRATLDEAAALLAAAPDGQRLLIVGHTDSDGSSRRNQLLSARRAQSVADYLIEAGVDPDRLATEGRGEDQLLVSPEITQADKQQNRRIEWEPLP